MVCVGWAAGLPRRIKEELLFDPFSSSRPPEKGPIATGILLPRLTALRESQDWARADGPRAFLSPLCAMPPPRWGNPRTERRGCMTVPTPEPFVIADSVDCPKWRPHGASLEERGIEGVACLRTYATLQRPRDRIACKVRSFTFSHIPIDL